MAGVDGCRGGWIAAIEWPDGACGLRLFAGFAALLQTVPPDALVLVDMPIGLPDQIRGPGRAAEQAARPHLGARRGSVFSIPAREAVEAGRGPFRDRATRLAAYRESCRLARLRSAPPSAVSIQGFGLFGKILEIDDLLRADPTLAERVLESHPELVLTGLAGAPCRYPKTVREGAAERRAILLAHGLPAGLAAAPRPCGAAEDDRLDACALLLAARRAQAGRIRRFPDPPERDRYDLPITIHA
ncbi:DUF429 domain-containing protein [Aureimonas jatrophae]|uniref:DUF429 domain-containing protein n=1 Tax=Aureimonas jatrophae TaxID=1166073 RepID=UPI001FCD8C97|nr:DUF429 domain-containing protein [Aureimonas jatrophae]